MKRLRYCQWNLIASMVLLFIVLPTTRADELEFQGDVTHVTTIDTLDPDGLYNKIWEPYLTKWNNEHYVAT